MQQEPSLLQEILLSGDPETPTSSSAESEILLRNERRESKVG